MRKQAAIAAVLALLASMTVWTASAEQTTVVSLSANAQAAVGETVAVDLCINSADTLGGVQGTISFDSGLTYTDATNHTETSSAETSFLADGQTVRFVILPDDGTQDGVWATLHFAVSETAVAGDLAAFTLSDVQLSDANGTPLDAPAVTGDQTRIVGEDNLYIQLKGASVRATRDLTKQGLRFEAEATTAAKSADIAAAGVVMLPESLLNGQELTLNTVGLNNTSPVHAEVTGDLADAVVGGEKLYVSLTNAVSGGRAIIPVVARAYVRLSDGTVIYSHNTSLNPEVTGGEATRSVHGVAQSIAASLGMTDTDTATTEQLLTYCVDNYNRIGG